MLACFLASTVADLQAGTEKTFPNAFVVCVFDHPATIINHGSKLVVKIEDPRTHRWIGLPFKDDPNAEPWPRRLVDTASRTDEVEPDGTLTIKGPVTLGFGNFKGGEVDVEFSTLPKRIKRLSRAP